MKGRSGGSTLPVAALVLTWGCSDPTAPSDDRQDSSTTEQTPMASGGSSPTMATGGSAVAPAGTGGAAPAGTGGAAPAGTGGAAEVPADGGTPDATAAAVTFPRSCADLYDESLFATFEVEIAASEWDAMRQDCEDRIEQYRPIAFRYGSESADAMMRLKGNWSWSCDKMQFVISFNAVDPDARFHGLRKIVLDAPWYDPTLIRERLASFYMQAYGKPSRLPYSCANNARLNINGEYYGVYTNIERIDREYLERHFEDPDGDLFKGPTDAMTLETNEETGSLAPAEAFAAATTVSELEALVDLEQAVSMWAGEAMIPDPDSYWAGVEINYYLYQDPGRGRLVFLPYDMDIAMGENIWPELAEADPILYYHPDWSREKQLEAVLSEPSWCQAYVTAVARARSAYDVDRLVAKIDAWSAQIADALAEDPHKTFTMQQSQDTLQALRTFPGRRAAFIDAWLEQDTHCPPDWSQSEPGRQVDPRR